jgi:DNA polymerase III epsilon subunit-like protein
MRTVFLDTEFTGEHASTTLVSIGLVGTDDNSLSVNFSDYDRHQVTPWLEENVLRHIDPTSAVTRAEAYDIVSAWFEAYSAGERVSIVSAGKLSDILLLFELWHIAFPDRRYFHHLECLPAYLNHAAHFDLPTIFFLAGVDPNVDREAFIGSSVPGPRHHALHDALVVRECYKRCVTVANFPRLAAPGDGSVPG